MGLEHLKSIFSEGIGFKKKFILQDIRLKESIFSEGVGEKNIPQYIGVKGGPEGNINFPKNYNPEIGGIHGGLSSTFPSFPFHPDIHSLFDDIGTNLPTIAGFRSFRSLYSDISKNVFESTDVVSSIPIMSPLPFHKTDILSFDSDYNNVDTAMQGPSLNQSKFKSKMIDELRNNLRDNFSMDMVPQSHQRPKDLGIPMPEDFYLPDPLDPLDPLVSGTLFKTNGWETLYNKDHTVKSDNPGYNHGLNVNRSNINIRYQPENSVSPSGLLNRAKGLIPNFPNGEPYMVTDIGDKTSSTRNIPIGRALKDGIRIGKYLASNRGLLFFAQQNLLGLVSNTVYGQKDFEKQYMMKTGNQMIHRFKGGYSPLSTLTATAGRLLGTTPNVLVDRHFPLSELFGSFDKFSTYGNWITSKIMGGGMSDNVHDSFGKVDLGPKGFFSTFADSLKGATLREQPMEDEVKDEDRTKREGDLYTNASINTDGTVAAYRTMAAGNLPPIHIKYDADIEGEKNGMPMYFKDLRDNSYVFFRAYIESLTENVSPTWNSENYMGRSEPVYTYQNAERDISFNLKLFANTRDELHSIYIKLNKLTSMCYPEYKEDAHMITGEEGDIIEENETSRDATRFIGKVRMKPPLIKFRLGELYGKPNKEMVGFLKPITYTFPDEGVWETVGGARVPKLIDVNISFQVLHMDVPSLTTKDFYGYPGT